MSDPVTPDEINPEPPTMARMQADLQQLARSIREASHLEPQTQSSLASLLEELGHELNAGGSLSDKAAHLAGAVSEVARSLHEQEAPGLIETARDRLKDAAARAEVDAPVATGVVNRFLDVLANMGI